ncbi:integrase arm-type DNA-binding domain-containing protein [Chromobacterium sp. LK1]|uniref:tyrosine-type recombinase/integrase n=1 Tax=Chromobacterium sp. LK1 TaxID=1628193 RepID=UPI00069E20CC|nr:integrase arm-type DNA-binding domain-containing protein [Chromobacterium sp. LK1]
MLSDTKVRQAKPTDKVYRLADAKGLCLEVRPSGQRFWRYRFRIEGKPSMFTIGEYPAISLAEARRLLEEARAMVDKGINPTTAKRVEKHANLAAAGETFEVLAADWMTANVQWSAAYRRRVANAMKTDVYPTLGALPVRDIKPPMIRNILDGIVKRDARTVARNVRMWISAVFNYGIASSRAESDPAQSFEGYIKAGAVQHHRPLAKADLPKFLNALEAYRGFGVAKPAAKLMLLTFVRTAEIRQAEWADIDLVNAIWRIPAHKMKMRTEHLVPLSRQAIALLLELKPFTEMHAHVFPNIRRPNAGIGESTINRLIGLIGFKGIVSGHGFRSTASTILYEHGYPEHIIERQLAHSERNKVKAAYNHAGYMAERKKMMQDWADLLDEQKKMATPSKSSSPL